MISVIIKNSFLVRWIDLSNEISRHGSAARFRNHGEYAEIG
jgi:hypothetical protein